jgi:hypothetical protein
MGLCNYIKVRSDVSVLQSREDKTQNLHFPQGYIFVNDSIGNAVSYSKSSAHSSFFKVLILL